MNNTMNAVSASALAPVLDLQQVSFRWRRELPPVLTIPAFRMEAAERMFLAGPSGAGKSTLLALIAGIAVPQAGDVQVLGHSLPKLGAAARDRFRADHLGIIFQMFNLLPYLPVLENVMLPCRFSPARRQQAVTRDGSQEAQARRLLGALGLQADTLLRRPVTELSVGQQQRVAAARALMGAPDLVIADEPTSALDADRRLEFVELLTQECDASGAALLFVSHDLSLAGRFQRQLNLAEINEALPEGAA